MIAEAPSRARLAALLDAMSGGLVEREEAARLVLLAAIAGEHVLLLGPPGTAKSELARRLRACLRDARWFERLLTRFSVPEELFGPLSLRALENDTYERLVEGYLPTAHVAFLDEIFKANSAILNALLSILNEREFDNGAVRVPVPLVCVVGASNEVPQGDELAALADRFLLRVVVPPVSDAGFAALLASGAASPPDPSLTLTEPELSALRAKAASVVLPPALVALLGNVRQRLNAARIYVSDRRWRKIARLVQLAAAVEGRDRAALADVGLVSACLWTRPEDRPVVVEHAAAACQALLREEPERIATLASALAEKLRAEGTAEMQATDARGALLYLDEDGVQVTEAMRSRRKVDASGNPLYRPPQGVAIGFGGQVTYQELWDGHFSQIPHGIQKLEAYVAASGNEVRAETPRTPVMTRRTYDAEHLASRRTQVAELLHDARSLLDALGELERERSGGLFGVVPATTVEAVHRGRERLEAACRTLEAAARVAAALPGSRA